MRHSPITASRQWRLAWYLRRAAWGGPPNYLNLEPTSRCNLSCVWCVASRSRPQGMLDTSLAEAILQQAASAGVREIRFFLAGEPLLHPRIADLVALARSKGLRTVLHTNAMLLTEQRSRTLLDAGLDLISFSINGLEESQVMQTQPGAELDVMAGHVRMFLEIRRQQKTPSTRSVLQVIQRPAELAAPLPRARLRALFGSPGPDHVLRLAPHGWGGQLVTPDVVRRGDRYHPCQPLWQGMSVGWDGRAFLCCADLNGTHVVGDLARQPLMEVWKGQELARVRSLVARNQRAGLPLCESCDAVWWKHHPAIHDIRRFGWRIARDFPMGTR